MRGLFRNGITPIIFLGLLMLAFGGRVEAGAMVSVNHDEKTLMALTSFSDQSLEVLNHYITHPQPRKPSQEIPLLLNVFKKVIAESEIDRGNDQNEYVVLINHLRLLVGRFSQLIDHLSGEQIQDIYRSFADVQFELSNTLAIPLKEFSEALKNKPVAPSSLPEVLLSQRANLLNEEVRNSLLDKVFLDMHRVYGQDEVYKKIIGSVVRPHHFFPVVVTPRFSGKTEFFKDLTRKLMMRDYPPHPLFHNYFKNVLILHFEATWMDLSHIPETMVVLRKLQKSQKRPLLVVVEDIDKLISRSHGSAPKFINGIRELQEEGVRFVGATSSQGLVNFRQEIDSHVLDEVMEPIPFAELSKEEFIKVTRERLAVAPEIVEDLGVQFEPEGLEHLARYILDEKETTQTIFYRMRRYLEELAVDHISNHPLAAGKVLEAEVKEFVRKRRNLPFAPDDPKETALYYKKLQESIESEVVGQSAMVREALEVHRDLMVNQNALRPLRVIGLIGPTGVGKTELAKALGKYAYGDPQKTLRIEGTAYGEKYNLWKLTGPTIGYKDSDQKGQLIDFLIGPGKEGGIILIDEGEKACQEFWQVMMPLLEEGFVVGGDGRARYLTNHLVIITSNRGDKQLYPKGFETWPPHQQKVHLAGFKQDQLKALFTERTGDQRDVLFPDFIVQRIDRFVVANQAQLDVAIQFAPQLMKKITDNIFDVYGKKVEIEPELLESFVRSNFRSRSGYRPLFRSLDYNFRRIIQNGLEAMGRDEKILKLHLENRQKEKKILVRIENKKKELEFDFPTSEEDSFFRDPHIFERLAKLPELIRSQVIGQEHIISPLVAAVQKHIIKTQGARRAPLSFINIGPTGVGKTELAKVLALGLLGSVERVGILPMGEVNSRQKWANFFGGDIGYQGGDVIRLFEQTLRANPQGGVIVLDEFSNVGGQDKGLKTELLKLLFNMIDEGRWISPTTGIEYDLSKYVFLLTGNDGQELYHGATDDHLRQTVWERNNKPERLIEILKSAGVPEALLGRMATLFWARPLAKKEMIQVAQKFMDHEKESLESRHLKVSYAKDFVEQVVSHSYTVTLGARSVRNFIENAIGGLIAKIEIEAFEKKLDLSESRVTLSFGGSEKKSPVVSSLARQNSEVYLEGKVSSKNFKSFTVSLGTKAFLAPRMAQTKRQAYATAIHESGHAVVNDYAKVGLKVLSITIDASGGHLGYVNFENNPSLSWSRQRVIARIASLLAGGLSQQMAGIGLDAGWSSDITSARSLATKAVVEWGLGSDLQSIFFPQTNEEKTHIKDEVLAKEVDQLMMAGYEMAKDVLAQKWDLILLVSHRLMRQFTLNQEEYEQLKTQPRLGHALYVRSDEGGETRIKALPGPRVNRCSNAIKP